MPLLLRFDFTLGLVGKLSKLFCSSEKESGCSIAKEGTVLFTTTRFLPRNLDLCCWIVELGGLAWTTELGGLAWKFCPGCSRDSGGRRSVEGPRVSGWTVGRKESSGNESSGDEVSRVSAPRSRVSGEPWMEKLWFFKRLEELLP